MSSRAAIRIEGLSFAYTPEAKVLSDIRLTIHPGERVALVGQNGSGKTTLARHLNGLLRPACGTIRLCGEETTGVPVAMLARKTALLFQNPEDQICRSTVRGEVAFGPENLGYPPHRISRMVEEALSWFALSDHARHNPHDLGYSERKRLALASILAMDTPIVVMDEPTAGLDARETGLLASALDHLAARKKTVLVISHDMDFVAAHLPRAFVLSRGAQGVRRKRAGPFFR